MRRVARGELSQSDAMKLIGRTLVRHGREIMVLTVFVCLALAGVGVTIFSNASRSSDAVITSRAAKQQSAGTLRCLTEPKNELAATACLRRLNIRSGQPGHVGASGRPGARGPAGARGPLGRPGHTGPRGARGERGAKGDRGSAGPQGPPGVTGPAGPPCRVAVDPACEGPPGPAGPAGPHGSGTGPGTGDGTGQGGGRPPMLVPGPPGAEGPAGPVGPPGPPGPPGPAGAAAPPVVAVQTCLPGEFATDPDGDGTFTCP
jgi:hypothetical protein